MSLRILASGTLIGDPQRRKGTKGPFATATIRSDGDEAVLLSTIAFGDEAERLLEFVKGDALAVSGRARLTSWTGRDGAEKHGIREAIFRHLDPRQLRIIREVEASERELLNALGRAAP